MVTATSQASGRAVTHTKRARPDFTSTVVATHSAIAASIWFAMPNSGHRLLMPPSGSIVPIVEEVAPAATTSPLQISTLGYQLVRPSAGTTLPSRSCSMKRATRVPASTVVRMNSASNMIAKWYQTASNVSPNALEKMLAMPTASDGAPPVRANSVRLAHLLRERAASARR